MNQDLTDINIILDRSGSMRSVESEVVGQINLMIDKQAKEQGKANISIYLFDTEFDTLMESVDVASGRRLRQEEFSPRGSTALYHAGCVYLDKIGKRLSDMQEKDRPARVVVAFVTDGKDNVPHDDFNFELFQNKIKTQKTKYNWEIVFIGTTDEAMEETSKCGIHVGCQAVMSSSIQKRYGDTPRAMLASSMEYLSNGIRGMRKKSGEELTSGGINFTEESLKVSAEDKQIEI